MSDDLQHLLPEDFDPPPYPAQIFENGRLSEAALAIAAEWAEPMPGACYLVRTFDIGLDEPRQVLIVMDNGDSYSLETLTTPYVLRDTTEVRQDVLAYDLTFDEAVTALSAVLLGFVMRTIWASPDIHPLMLTPMKGSA